MLFRKDHSEGDFSAVKKPRMKNRRAQPQAVNVPPLFDPDPKRNREAWVQKCFPDAPTTQPENAMRLWLGRAGKDRPTGIVGTYVGHTDPKHVPRQDGIDDRLNGHRSDDQLAAKLQRIAEMVTAALYNEQQRREPEDVFIRHPIHWNEADQVRPYRQ